MEKTYNPHIIEKKYNKLWEEKNLFSAEINNSNDYYTIILPPPNVTGSLHMGHAFQYSIMDTLTRTYRMKGHKTLWQPGTDHAGIATQMIVERQLNAKNITKYDLGRDAFIDKIWQWKKKSGNTITKQMRRLGASVDWQKEKFTMDDDMSFAVNKAFIDLYNDGEIYRGKKLINWDPILLTAISDLEVIATEENGYMWSISYPLKDSDELITVATTRPETILGDSAVAVNPNDKRYQHLIGKTVILPLIGRNIPVIADEYVDMKFGTGCVKITPAHDFNDYAIGKKHKLANINILTKDAKINKNGGKYEGLDRFIAREKIIEDLKILNLLISTKKHTLMIPRSDRTGTIIEPYLTDQWFVKTDKLAKKAINAVKNGEINFVPKSWQKTYFNWMNNIEDWCISRQIWWGHRIPAYFDEDGKVYVANSLVAAQKQAPNKKLTQDEDVLDTWFSSALWPFSTLGWPNNKQLMQFYPTNVLVTGFDIIFFWVARMIMFGLKFTDKVPFKDVYITGLVRDIHGNKMSKSKGNVLDPIDVIDGISLNELITKRTTNMMQEKIANKIKIQTKKEFPNGINAYGADALRFNFIANASFTSDIKFDLKQVEGYRNFCNKLWNAARFIFSNIDDINKYTNNKTTLATTDKWILSRLQQIKININKHVGDYRLDLMAKELYDFVWHDFCDWYIELSKQNITKSNTKATLIVVLDEVLALLHPVIPFITEEIYANFNNKDLLSQKKYPLVNKKLINNKAIDETNWIKSFIIEIRKIRSNMHVAPNKKIPCFVDNIDSIAKKYLNNNLNTIINIAKLTDISHTFNKNDEYASVTLHNMKILIPLKNIIDKKLEISRLNKEIKKLKQQINISNTKLKNEKFINNAKKEVILIEKQRLSTAKININNFIEQLQKINKI